MSKVQKIPFPGQRIMRSTVAVLLCFAVYFLRNQRGIPFYSALAALQCMQPYQDTALKVAKNRLTGTAVGAAWGLVLLLLLIETAGNPLLFYGLISLFTGAVLYSTVLLGIRQTAYFSCVVFLSITVNHIADENPFLFACNRALDTLIGVGLALLVNQIHLPRERQLDTLFVSGVDDTMLESGGEMSPYSLIELNRLIEQGANFTVSTNRTPATIRETLPGIRWKLPVIAMDGAVLYDMAANTYLTCKKMVPKPADSLLRFLQERNINCFTNVVLDDTLVILYKKLTNEAQRGIYEKHRRSPYRNYIHQENIPSADIVYLLVIEKENLMRELYAELLAQSWWGNFRVVYRKSENYEGYAYMKIYAHDATRENMLSQLQQQLNLPKAVTFGSIEGACDVVVHDVSKDTMVRRLKQAFEPVRFPHSGPW